MADIVAHLVQKQMEVANRMALEESSAQRENEDLIAAEKISQTQTQGLAEQEEKLKEISARVEKAQQAANEAREAIVQSESALQKLQQERSTLNEKLSAVKTSAAVGKRRNKRKECFPRAVA